MTKIGPDSPDRADSADGGDEGIFSVIGGMDC
jgi:hypothetical protein